MTSGRVSSEAEPVKVDARDKKIIAMLLGDSRMQASEIAKNVLLSRDAVSYRINRLVEQGVILGFVPKISLSAFGYNVFHVYLLLDEKKKAKHAALANFLLTHPNTLSVMGYTDTWDTEWVVGAKNLREFDVIITGLLTQFSDVILETEKLAVIRTYTYGHAPGSLLGKEGTKNISASRVELDDKDLKLLLELCTNCRQSSYDLSRKVDMSPDAVVYRINGLKQKGVISGFTIVLNLSKLGYSWYTYAISFGKFDSNDEKKFGQFVIMHPHILRAVKVFGGWDVLLSISTSTLKEYHATVKQIKNTFAENMYHYQTWLANEEHFVTPMPAVIFSKGKR